MGLHRPIRSLKIGVPQLHSSRVLQSLRGKSFYTRHIKFYYAIDETVEKVANATFSSRPHEISGSISCEIAARNFVRGVISEAHVLGNDRIEFYSAVCGRRNSLQEGFFDSLKIWRIPGNAALHIRMILAPYDSNMKQL